MFCNYCHSTEHFYTECMLSLFDVLVYDIVRREQEKNVGNDVGEDRSKLAGSSNVTYPGESAYDHMHQSSDYMGGTSFADRNREYPDVTWGSFWASEKNDTGYADMEGPSGWYDEGGHGDA